MIARKLSHGDLPHATSFSKCLEQSGQGLGKARSPALHPHLPRKRQGHKAGSHYLLPPRMHISSKLDGKESSRGWERGTRVLDAGVSSFHHNVCDTKPTQEKPMLQITNEKCYKTMIIETLDLHGYQQRLITSISCGVIHFIYTTTLKTC